MADLKFSCPRCGVGIECDELWSGREVQCPSCQASVVVPQKPAGPPHATLAAATASQPKLAINAQGHRPSAAMAAAPQVVALQKKLAEAKAAKKSPVMKWVTVAVVLIVLGVGGFIGYPYVSDYLAKRAEAKKAAATPPVTNAAPAEVATPPPPKELPVLPAVWTLDLEKAKIPEGRANGMLSGTNFLVETARLDKVGTSYLLQMFQGPPAAPDLAMRIYLHLNAGESPTGRAFTVSPDMKGKGVPQVVKLWKTNPKYAAQQKTYFSGYAMKLELGTNADNTISGKIFLALPDPEQSVVVGVFKGPSSLGGATAGGAPAAEPAAVPTAASDAQRAAFERRYGKKAPGAP